MAISTPINTDTQMSEYRHVEGHYDLVDWTLSGHYDWDCQVLIDADNPSRYLSRRSVSDLVTRLVGMFKPDNTVCLHIPNDVLYPVLVLVILASKCRWTGTNPAYTDYELCNHLQQSQSNYLIVMKEDLHSVEENLRIRGLQNVQIIIFSDVLDPKKDPLLPDHPCLHDWLREVDYARLDRYLGALEDDSAAMLQSTSGTTGFPKMAVRTHRAIMLETAAIEDYHAAKPYPVRRLWCTPIFHAFSTPEMLFNAIRLGIPTYIMKRFDDTFAQKIADFRITEIAAPPPLLNKLIQDKDSHRRLQSVKAIFTGGTILAPKLRSRVLDIFVQKPRIVQVWGMTEGGWFTTFKYPEDDATSSVGRLIPGLEIEISASTRVTAAEGQEAGELLIRGRQLMTGYQDNGLATVAAFENGWLKTGDVGYVEDGKVYLVDRVKDLIKVNGWQVAPAEIENAVLQSKNIQDAAAISVGSGVDEHPMVFLVITGSITTEDIESLLRIRLARYKVAQVEIKFVDEIPRNLVGKILRTALKAHAFALGWIKDERETATIKAKEVPHIMSMSTISD